MIFREGEPGGEKLAAIEAAIDACPVVPLVGPKAYPRSESVYCGTTTPLSPSCAIFPLCARRHGLVPGNTIVECASFIQSAIDALIWLHMQLQHFEKTLDRLLTLLPSSRETRPNIAVIRIVIEKRNSDSSRPRMHGAHIGYRSR